VAIILTIFKKSYRYEPTFISLFDLGLISINPKTMTIVIAPELLKITYGQFADSALLLPSDPKHSPSTAPLPII
jgi:hypothetical protein